MSDEKEPPTTKPEGKSDPPKKKGGSGEHPAVIAYRAKMESITENTLPAIDAVLNEMEKKASSSPPPPVPEEEHTPVPVTERTPPTKP